MHLEVRVGDGEPFGHAENRRDADAAGQQQAARGMVREREVILTARNTKWLGKLQTYQNAFVAVGLGHLLGETGLPAMLTKAGYTVERVAR